MARKQNHTWQRHRNARVALVASTRPVTNGGEAGKSPAERRPAFGESETCRADNGRDRSLLGLIICPQDLSGRTAGPSSTRIKDNQPFECAFEIREVAGWLSAKSS